MKNVDGRVKPGHDDGGACVPTYFITSAGSMNFFTTKAL
jgi:hypothetical protein